MNPGEKGVADHCDDGDDWIEVRFDNAPDEICPCRWDELSA